METLIADLVKQVPSLVVLAWVVMVFLKHINEAAVRSVEQEKETRRVLQSLGDNCHAFQRETTGRIEVALNRNSDALSRAAVISDNVQEVLQEAVDVLRTSREERP